MKGIFNDITINHFPSIYRPSNKPLVSGDSFRNFANHIFDETTTLKPTNVKNNDLVFVSGSVLNIFLKFYHKKINANYILLVHNSLDSVNEDIKTFLDEKIIHCFAKNLNFTSNSKISLLPAGFKNKRYGSKEYNRLIKHLLTKKSKPIKINKIMGAFSLDTHSDRVSLNNIIKNSDVVDNYKHLDTREYFNKLAQYKYSICPRGTGLDSYRIWESLLVNTIPITLETPFSKNLKSYGIPIILLNNWQDILNFNENILSQNNFDDQSFNKFVKFDYWKSKINNKKI